nr:MAG TPA: hypothetical protein [Caudoviricetes sp.]
MCYAVHVFLKNGTKITLLFSNFYIENRVHL